MSAVAPRFERLEDNEAWRQANELAEFFYSVLGDLPDTEEWNSRSKLRSAASDLIFHIAEAIGDASPSGNEYTWGDVRKHLFALKSMYRFVCKQEFLELDLDIMIKIDKLIKHVEQQVTRSYKETQDAYDRELEPWLRKHKLWKEMHNEN